MLIFDELKKNDPQLRLVAVMLVAGLCLLLARLWWVQVVSAREYQSHQETQAYRTVRLPAVRGKIMDREGRVLAENLPRYNLNLYFNDLRSQFRSEYERLRPVKLVTNAPPFWKFWLGSKWVVTNRVRLSRSQIDALNVQARCNVASNLVTQISGQLGQPLRFDAADFNKHYGNPYVPYPILKNVNATNIARFEEQFNSDLGAGLELESARFYPGQTTAAHLLGYVRRNNDSINGEDSAFSYRLPDYQGVIGMEGGFDAQLHGLAGAESVLINSQGYRQSENIPDAPEPGENIVLTIDLDIQRAAEKSLVKNQGEDAHAAIVVMDVRSGDILAMVSSPAFDPNDFVQGFSQAEYDKMQASGAEHNRVTGENFAPGSIFKPIVGLACLEDGLDPKAKIYNSPNPADPAHGHIKIGNQTIRDTAPTGDYDLRRAIMRSSNTYFITNGMKTGIEKIIRLGQKFHLGEDMDLQTRQDAAGTFPSLKRVAARSWRDGDTANICFGQGEVAVTPLQMAVAYSAIANGGKVLRPRLIDRIEPQDPASGEVTTNFPSGVVRNELGVQPRNLQILHDAMLAETEDPEGTGKAAVVSGLHICGKTGTAQVTDSANRHTGWNYWFASFAPYENPRYAVVVLVESQNTGSGGSVCAPIAHDIYAAIVKNEKSGASRIAAKK